MSENIQLAFEPEIEAPPARRVHLNDLDLGQSIQEVIVRDADDFELEDWARTLGPLELDVASSSEDAKPSTSARVADCLERVGEQDWIVFPDDLYALLDLMPGKTADDDAFEMMARSLSSLGLVLVLDADGSETDPALAAPALVAEDVDDLVEAIRCAIPEDARHPGHVPKRRWGSLDEDRAFADLHRGWKELYSALASDPAALLDIAKAAADHLEGVLGPIRFSATEIDWRKRPDEASGFARAANLLCAGMDGGFRTDRASIQSRIDGLRQLDIEIGYLEGLVSADSTCPMALDVRARVIDRLGRIRAIEHRLLMMHAGHVLRMAEKYQDLGLEVDDLFQIGFLGLMRSIRKFDHEIGIRLQAYAGNWIRQYITRAVEDQAHAVRLPAHRSAVMRDLEKVRAELERMHLSSPRADAIAARLGKDESVVSMLLSVPRQAVDMGELPDRADDSSTSDAFEMLQHEQFSTFLAGMMEKMPERQAYILRRRYGLDGDEPMTLEELGDLEGVTRERIRQIEAKALEWLRHPSRMRQLEQAW